MKRFLLFSLLSLLLPASAPAQTSLRAAQDPDTELWGFVDARGEWAIAPAFEECHPYSFSSGFRLGSVKYKGRWGCIDRKGAFVIRPVFSYGDSYLAGQHLLAGTPVGRVLYRIQDRDTGKWGFVNHLGNWAILPRYEDCHPYSFGEGINFASVQYRGKWGCINKKGEFVVKPVFSYDDSYLAGMEWQNSPDYAVVPASQVANYVPDGTDMNPQTTTARNLAEHAADTTVRTPAEDAAPPAAVTPPTVAILSPKDGTGYDLDEVVIRYEAKTADGKAPEIMVSIDNEPYDMTAWGVRRVGDEPAAETAFQRGSAPHSVDCQRFARAEQRARLPDAPIYGRATQTRAAPARRGGWDNTTTRTSPTSHMRPKMRRISPGQWPEPTRRDTAKSRNRFC